jgi:hypothetical protein
MAAAVREAVARAPELARPITDLGVLDAHRDVVDALMTAVFPSGSWEREHSAVAFPFSFRTVYATPAFAAAFVGPDGILNGQASLDPATIIQIRLLYAYSNILRVHYDLQVPVEYPINFTLADPATGLDRHFQMVPDARFLEVQARRPLRPLSPAERQQVLARLREPEALAEVLPPEWFRFSGFIVFRAIDVTVSEVLSALKRDLIERESIISTDRFTALQLRLRTLFRRPDLTLSLAGIEGERVLMLNSGSALAHGCILADSSHHSVRDFAGSLCEQTVLSGRPLVVDDLAELPDRTWLEDHFLERGERSLMVAPLTLQGETVGTLRLAVPEPGVFTSSSVLRLHDVLPLFAMGVKRSLDELESRLQAVMKEQYTAIHPSVEWRFRRAVLEAVEAREGDGPVELAPIVFPDVHPLYAITDIRGSSTQRNLAIQGDLGEHLALARQAVREAHGARPLPILDELAYRIDKHARRVERGLGSGDDVAVVEFLRGQVDPALAYARGLSPEIRRAVERYEAALDPETRSVNRRRREFEESVTLINETVAAYLDEEEALAQRMVPHYFEKQSTDGVDYGIFVGAALLEDGRFDPLQLRNLRLWQLLVTCGIARRVEPLKARLTLPLEVTHLVLVHGSALSIRFRQDEKRFDVDGAYNMRYEIVKKRIDKVHVRGTGERLTQPGRIAIVFSQPNEIAEYRDYVEYLSARGLLRPGVEELELEDLQGVKGLRALRVAIELALEPDGARPEPRAVLAETAVRQPVAAGR